MEKELKIKIAKNIADCVIGNAMRCGTVVTVAERNSTVHRTYVYFKEDGDETRVYADKDCKELMRVSNSKLPELYHGSIFTGVRIRKPAAMEVSVDENDTSIHMRFFFDYDADMPVCSLYVREKEVDGKLEGEIRGMSDDKLVMLEGVLVGLIGHVE